MARASWLRSGPGILVSLAAVVCAVVAGCATTPSGGPPRPATGGNNQVQAYVQPLPPPGPTSRWQPQAVVLGFLHASASYAFDPAAARQYLSPALRKNWNPGPVVVVADNPRVAAPSKPNLVGLGGRKLLAPDGAGTEKLVTVTGQYLATLSQSGQYQYVAGQSATYQFVLARTGGVWLIQQFLAQGGGSQQGGGRALTGPQQTLVLTESDFEHVYQPRNLFFYAGAPAAQPGDELVPDPVYAPTQSATSSALNTDLATKLVKALLNGPGSRSWLAGDAYTAFPEGTRLLKPVTLSGKTAQVDLGGAAAKAPSRAYQMAAQLLATLSNGQYSPPLADQVQLSVNNKLTGIDPQLSGLIPTVPDGPVAVVTGAGRVSQLPAAPKGTVKQPQLRLGTGQIGPAQVTAVAATPDSPRPQTAVAVPASGGGCQVQVHPASGSGNGQQYTLPGSTAPCTSLSYDPAGNLWAAAGGGVWVLQPDHAPAAVTVSGITAAVGPDDKILALRMAPDGVRAALLVAAPGGPNQLLLAAVRMHGRTAALGQPVTVGTGLTDAPLAVSWYDDYHLAVLAAGGIWRVPLTGGSAQQPSPELISTTPPGEDAATLTTNGSELFVGSRQGGIWAAPASSPTWISVTSGADPVYPG